MYESRHIESLPFPEAESETYLVDNRAHSLGPRLGIFLVRALGAAAAAAVALVVLLKIAVLAHAAPPAFGRRERGLTTTTT
jgi:hypothetical protein